MTVVLRDVFYLHVHACFLLPTGIHVCDSLYRAPPRLENVRPIIESQLPNSAPFYTYFRSFPPYVPYPYLFLNPRSPLLMPHCIIRRLVLIVDYSAAVLRKDFLPDRLHLLRDCALPYLIHSYLHLHAVSYLAVIATREGVAELICDFQMSPETVLNEVEKYFAKTSPSGTPSVENALRLVLHLFTRNQATSTTATHEILYLASSLNSADPGDVTQVIEQTHQEKIHTTVIGFGAQTQMLFSLASEGHYYVPLQEKHLEEILHLVMHRVPYDSTTNSVYPEGVKLLPFGFPTVEERRTPQICVCHLNYVQNVIHCPQCEAVLCGSLPRTCVICGLDLLSSAFLSRAQMQQNSEKKNFMVKMSSTAEKAEISASSLIQVEGLMLRRQEYPLGQGGPSTVDKSNLAGDQENTETLEDDSRICHKGGQIENDSKSPISDRERYLLTVKNIYCFLCHFPLYSLHGTARAGGADTATNTSELELKDTHRCIKCGVSACRSCTQFSQKVLMCCPNCPVDE